MAKAKRNSAKELKKLDHFARKLSRRPWVQGRERQRETEADRAAEVIFMRIHPKSWSIFPLKVVASLLGGPCKGAIGA